FLDDLPIKARPVSAPERAWRWCYRNKRTAVLTSALTITLIALAITFGVVRTRALQSRRAIEEAGQLAQERLRIASEAMAEGDYRDASDLLAVADPIVARAPELATVREDRRRLSSQVALFKEFQNRLDEIRFKALLGGSLDPAALERECRDAIQF